MCVPNKQDGPGQVEHARYQLANRLQRLSTSAMVGANGNPGGGGDQSMSFLVYPMRIIIKKNGCVGFADREGQGRAGQDWKSECVASSV